VLVCFKLTLTPPSKHALCVISWIDAVIGDERAKFGFDLLAYLSTSCCPFAAAANYSISTKGTIIILRLLFEIVTI
jgi:hypothetical protein